MFKRLLLLCALGLLPGILAVSAPGAVAMDLAAADQAQTVNINSADASAIAATLSGVGLSRARAIVEYRDSYGPFLALEDLLEVRGIGPAILEKNRHRIVLE